MGLPKGRTNNLKGRPKKSFAFAEKLRQDARVPEIWNKLFEVANTLGGEKEHKEALQAAKLIVDKTVPSLKCQSFEVDTETLDNFGVIVLPAKMSVGVPVN
jgi:hypothetical protein